MSKKTKKKKNNNNIKKNHKMNSNQVKGKTEKGKAT